MTKTFTYTCKECRQEAVETIVEKPITEVEPGVSGEYNGKPAFWFQVPYDVNPEFDHHMRFDERKEHLQRFLEGKVGSKIQLLSFLFEYLKHRVHGSYVKK